MRRFTTSTMALLAAGGLASSMALTGSAWAAEPVQVAAKGQFIAPQWSPDGKHLAMTGPGYKGIYVVQTDGQNLRQISDEPGAGYRFAWSPDGKRIAFKSKLEQDGKITKSVKIAAVDGSGNKTVAQGPADLGVPVWLDKSTIQFSDGQNLATAGLDGKVAPTKAASKANVLSVGKCNVTVVADATENDRVVVIAADGSKKYLTSPTDGRYFDVRVSPDGTQVLVHKLDGHIYLFDLSGIGRNDLGEGHGATWSPDGKQILCNTAKDDGHDITEADIVVIDARSGARRTVTQTQDRLEMHAAWSPDGKQIAYGDGKSMAIFVQTLEAEK